MGSTGVVSVSSDGTNWTLSNTATTQQLNDIIYADGKFVAAGNSGALETSYDGETWTLQNSGTTQILSSLAYGNGKFVTVGPNAVMTSSDAVTWTPAVSGLSGANQVAGSSQGFVAIQGSSTNAYFSSDGLNWVTDVLPVSVTDAGPPPFYPEPFSPQIISYANGVFLVGGRSWVASSLGELIILASPDGKNWPTNVVVTTGPPFGDLQYNFFLAGNTNVMAGGLVGGNPVLQTSANVLNWSQISNTAGGANAGAYGNGVYAAVVSSQTIYTSTDGVSWTNQQHAPAPPAPPTGPTGNFYSIAASNGTYVVATSASFVASTNDMVYAVESNTPSLSSVILFSNTFVACGPGGAIYQSTNGFTWTQRNSGTADNFYGVTSGANPLGSGGNGDQLVAVGDNGAIQTSPSGVTWTSRQSGTSLPLYGVTYSNGLYVAVGQEGTVVSSVDGENWTVQDSGQLNNLLSVTYGTAGFLAVGQGGTILTSPDGANWTQQNSGTSATFESASYGNGYYLVTGSNAVAMSSPDGTNWTGRNIGATSGQTLFGSAFLNGRFDVVGSGGTVLESDPVPLLFVLQMSGHPPQCAFKIFATPGTSYRILTCTNITSPSWFTAATVNNAAAITLWTNTMTAGNQRYFRVVSP